MDTMKRLLLPVLIGSILLAVVISGCFEKGNGPSTSAPNVNSEQIKALSLSAAKNVTTYKFSIDTTQNMEMINNTSGLTSNVTMITTAQGATDFKAKAASVTQTLKAYQGQDTNSTSVESSTYVINDTIYVKFGNNWTSVKMPDAAQFWESQNMILAQTDMINASQVQIAGTETVDGVKCYGLKVTPSLPVYAAILYEHVGSVLPVMYMNLTELYNSGTSDWAAWTTQDTHLLKKSTMDVAFTVTAKVLGATPTEVGNTEIKVNLASTSDFSDFNSPVQIALPPAAKSATVMTATPVTTTPVSAPSAA